MKKILILLIATVLLFSSCSKRPDRAEFDNEKVKELKQVITAEDLLCGVAYLGYMDGTFEDVIGYLQEQKYYSELSFLKDISLDRFASNDGGELYCVIPASSDVSITVRDVKLDSEDSSLMAGAKLISISDGSPILIKGNMSEIVPNLLIESVSDEETVIFSPFLSLENGKMANADNRFFDFSPYDLMEHFKNME